MRRAGGGPINSERLKPAESEWERKAADGSEAAMRDFKREGCSGEGGGRQWERRGDAASPAPGGSPLIKGFLSRGASLMAFSQRTA